MGKKQTISGFLVNSSVPERHARLRAVSSISASVRDVQGATYPSSHKHKLKYLKEITAVQKLISGLGDKKLLLTFKLQSLHRSSSILKCFCFPPLTPLSTPREGKKKHLQDSWCHDDPTTRHQMERYAPCFPQKQESWVFVLTSNGLLPSAGMNPTPVLGITAGQRWIPEKANIYCKYDL